MNKFNENEFIEICNKFNEIPTSREISLNDISEDFFNEVKNALASDRRGEAVFCVIRPNGKAITVTCEEYPKGIYRIPTGGIGHDENIVKAVIREAKEELGLNVEVISFAGVLKIQFEFKDESVMFYSYLFILKETGGRLLLDASDNEVSEVKEVDIDELNFVVKALNNIKGKRNSWGKFRFQTSNAILNYLRSNPDVLGNK